MTSRREPPKKYRISDGYKEAYIKFETRVRNTDIREFMASSILSERQWSIFLELKRELASRSLTLLTGVPLTAIIDPVLYLLEDSLWRSSVLFAVVTLAPHGAVRLLVLDTKNDAMERCLDRLNVPHIADNALLQDRDFVRLVLNEVDFQLQSASSAKQLINISEHDVAETLRKRVLIIEYEHLFDNDSFDEESRNDAELSSFKLLHEVALHRICKSDLIIRHLTREENHIRETSSVDFLINAPPPLRQPLLALEFDGKHHEDPKQQKKDRLKDAVLDRFGIPLIRISHADGTFGSLKKYGRADWHRRYVEALTDLAGNVLWLKYFDNNFSILKSEAKKGLYMLEDRFANAIFGKSYVYLNEEQRGAVMEATVFSTENDEFRFQNSLHSHERDNAIQEAKEDAEWPKDLLQYSNPPVVFGDHRSGYWAEFKVRLSSGKNLDLVLPRVWIQAGTLDPELLELLISGSLVQIAADWVRQIIRMNTPAVRN